jgi:hypothetical protein
MMTLLSLKRLDVQLDRDVVFLVESGEEGTTGPGIGFMTSQHVYSYEIVYDLARRH